MKRTTMSIERAGRLCGYDLQGGAELKINFIVWQIQNWFIALFRRSVRNRQQ